MSNFLTPRVCGSDDVAIGERCYKCYAKIKEGDTIKDLPGNRYQHSSCQKIKKTSETPQERRERQVRNAGKSAGGHQGRVIRKGENFS